jgi:hypothetical protein
MAAGLSQPLPGPVAPITAPRAVAVLGDTGQEGLRRLLGLELGRAYSAQLLSRLPDGDFVVGIAGTAARMNLPAGSQVGDQLLLTLIGKEPRPRFLLQQAEQPQPPAPSLSPAARLIDSLLQTGRADALPGTTPLLPDAEAAAAQAAPLAAALRGALEHSGLFYESHVAQWAAGERSIEQLLREPQMQAAASSGLQPGADAAALPAMQLDALEQRRVAWHGELFPGQPLRWEVRASGEREPEPQAGAGDEPRAWNSELKLELPGLGALQISLGLRADRLQLQLAAGAEDSAALLRSEGAALALALQAAGIALEQFSVRHEPA